MSFAFNNVPQDLRNVIMGFFSASELACTALTSKAWRARSIDILGTTFGVVISIEGLRDQFLHFYRSVPPYESTRFIYRLQDLQVEYTRNLKVPRNEGGGADFTDEIFALPVHHQRTCRLVNPFLTVRDQSTIDDIQSVEITRHPQLASDPNHVRMTLMDHLFFSIRNPTAEERRVVEFMHRLAERFDAYPQGDGPYYMAVYNRRPL